MPRFARLFFALLIAVLSGLVITACGPTYPACDNDDHCASHNQVCVDKQCVDCRDASQCNKVDPCMVCTSGYTCARQERCCKTDLDCPGGRCWRDSGSTTGICGGQCQSDDHCPDGQRCAGEQCVPDISCNSDSDCSSGQRCVSGSCAEGGCEIITITFDFNEYSIRLDQEETIASNAACLKELMAPHRVEGHCDDRGSDEYNLALGQRRAGAVARQYKALGVGEGMLSTISWGEERPMCSQGAEDCWNQNRRVETVPR
ncbi:MAG: hypothetical protein CL940_10210 [Deltaproteobacteria bacterium]|nr:hypothetical protein [Deltaproteobacteria bacterium]